MSLPKILIAYLPFSSGAGADPYLYIHASNETTKQTVNVDRLTNPKQWSLLVISILVLSARSGHWDSNSKELCQDLHPVGQGYK